MLFEAHFLAHCDAGSTFEKTLLIQHVSLEDLYGNRFKNDKDVSFGRAIPEVRSKRKSDKVRQHILIHILAPSSGRCTVSALKFRTCFPRLLQGG